YSDCLISAFSPDRPSGLVESTGREREQNMAENAIGLVGLAVMGENLAMNMRNHGFSVSVYNRTGERTSQLVANRGRGLHPTYEVAEVVASLAKTRKVFLMVKAGTP